MVLAQPLTTSWSESAQSSGYFSGPALRHGSLNSLFQVASYLPFSKQTYSELDVLEKQSKDLKESSGSIARREQLDKVLHPKP